MSKNPIRLPVFETIRTSWEKVKGSKGIFWTVIFFMLLIQFVINCHSFTANDQPILHGDWHSMIETWLSNIPIIILGWGLIYLAVQRAMGLPIQFNMLRQVFNFDVFFKMIGLTILKLIVLLPVIIFILLPRLLVRGDPSTIATNMTNKMALFIVLYYLIGVVLFVYLSVRMKLASAVVIVKKSNPWKAIQISFKATKSNVWRLIGLYLLTMLIVVLSAIPLGIGLIWSLPFSVIVYAMTYKNLVLSRQDLTI